MGRGILLLRDSGLEEEESEAPSSPCRSDREPMRESSSWERSEAEDSGSLAREATTPPRRSDSEGEAVGEGTAPWWWLAFFCRSFSLAEPGGGSSRRLDGSSTGMRLCLRLGSFRGAAGEEEEGEEAGTLVWSGIWIPSLLCWGSGAGLWLLSGSFSVTNESLLAGGGDRWPLANSGLRGERGERGEEGERGGGGERGEQGDDTRLGMGLGALPCPLSGVSARGSVGTWSWGEVMSAVCSWTCWASASASPPLSSRRHCGTMSDPDWEDSPEGR